MCTWAQMEFRTWVAIGGVLECKVFLFLFFSCFVNEA